MGPPAVGEVVLVPFPFSDLSQSKVRPAVCLAAAGGVDWVLCQVTSKAYGDSRAVPVGDPDFASGGLKIASFARPSKLFTASQSLIVGSAGQLNDAAFQRILDAVIDVLRPGGP